MSEETKTEFNLSEEQRKALAEMAEKQLREKKEKEKLDAFTSRVNKLAETDETIKGIIDAGHTAEKFVEEKGAYVKELSSERSADMFVDWATSRLSAGAQHSEAKPEEKPEEKKETPPVDSQTKRSGAPKPATESERRDSHVLNFDQIDIEKVDPSAREFVVSRQRLKQKTRPVW